MMKKVYGVQVVNFIEESKQLLIQEETVRHGQCRFHINMITTKMIIHMKD